MSDKVSNKALIGIGYAILTKFTGEGDREMYEKAHSLLKEAEKEIKGGGYEVFE